jgi:hypothetical protein
VRSGSQRFLPVLPDHVDLGVVGDRLQRDVRNPFVDEALADIAVSRGFLRRRASDLALFALPLGAVGEQVIRVARAHNPRSRQRQGHARGVDRDPAPAPLFGDSGGRAGAAGRIQHQVARIGGHQDQALHYSWCRLNDVNLPCRATHIRPDSF